MSCSRTTTKSTYSKSFTPTICSCGSTRDSIHCHINIINYTLVCRKACVALKCRNYLTHYILFECTRPYFQVNTRSKSITQVRPCRVFFISIYCFHIWYRRDEDAARTQMNSMRRTKLAHYISINI